MKILQVSIGIEPEGEKFIFILPDNKRVIKKPWQQDFVDAVWHYITGDRKKHFNEWSEPLIEWLTKKGTAAAIPTGPLFGILFASINAESPEELREVLRTGGPPKFPHPDREKMQLTKWVPGELRDLDFIWLIVNPEGWDMKETMYTDEKGNKFCTVVCEKKVPRGPYSYVLTWDKIPIKNEDDEGKKAKGKKKKGEKEKGIDENKWNKLGFGPLLARTFLHLQKAAFIAGDPELSFKMKKKEALNQLGLEGIGGQYERLENCFDVFYNTNAQIKNIESGRIIANYRVLNTYIPGEKKSEEAYFSLNKDYFYTLRRALESPHKNPYKVGSQTKNPLEKLFYDEYKNRPARLPVWNMGGASRRQMQFISFLAKYKGLESTFEFSLKTVFLNIGINEIEIIGDKKTKGRGLPWALAELNDCLKYAVEQKENTGLIDWKYIPSKSTQNILKNLAGYSSFQKSFEGFSKEGPEWILNKFKKIHSMDEGLIKALKQKGVIIPKKLDAVDVLKKWKIVFIFGTKKQTELDLRASK